MILTNVSVYCENQVGLQSECVWSDQLSFDHVPTPEELAAALEEAGYITDDDGKHWCSRHADRGLKVTVGPDYQEIAPGVLVRASRFGGPLVIEVKRESADDGKPIPHEVPC